VIVNQERSSHAARNAALASFRLSATPSLGRCVGAGDSPEVYGAITHANRRPDVCTGSILSKKVFLAGEEDFSAPLVHPARVDVRDHVESQEGDHGASYACDRGLQKRRQSKTDFREILGAPQFLTFSTASAIS
jgi:hypothetical protein